MGVQLYVPGRGNIDLSEYRVDKAVNEYDERLYFARNLSTGQWCIYLRTVPSEPDLPLLGFDEVPHPEDAIKRLYRADTLRHGEKILDEMNRHNEKIREQARKDAAEAAEELAEVVEWAHRKEGLTEKYTKVFVGGK